LPSLRQVSLKGIVVALYLSVMFNKNAKVFEHTRRKLIHMRARLKPGVIELTKSTLNIRNEAELKAFMDELGDCMEKIDIEYGETLWKKYLHEPCRDLNEIERKRSQILLNDQYFKILNTWQPKTHDSLLKKRLRNAKRIFLRERVEALNERAC